MIQRIQTVLLIIVSALMLSMLLFPYAHVLNDNAIYSWSAEGISTVAEEGELVQPIWALFTLVVVMMSLPIVTIFMYKKRLLQMRFCVFNTILMVAFYGTFGYFWWNMHKHAGAVVSMRLPLLLPLVAIVLNIIAIRKILQDEILVRSLDRIR